MYTSFENFNFDGLLVYSGELVYICAQTDGIIS